MMTLVETKMKVEMNTTMVRVFLVIGQIIFLKCFFAKWTTWFLVDSLVILHFRLALKFLFTNITCQLSFVHTSSFMHNNIVFSRITSATITTKNASILWFCIFVWPSNSFLQTSHVSFLLSPHLLLCITILSSPE